MCNSVIHDQRQSVDGTVRHKSRMSRAGSLPSHVGTNLLSIRWRGLPAEGQEHELWAPWLPVSALT